MTLSYVFEGELMLYKMTNEYYQNEVVHMLLELSDANYFKDDARQLILTDMRTDTWAYIPQYAIDVAERQSPEHAEELKRANDKDFFRIAYQVLSTLKYEKNNIEGRRQKVLEFVISESPFIYRLKIHQLLSPSNRFKCNDFILIKGAVQSGKSALIRGIASVLLSYGITPVLVLRDFKGDYFQMKDGIMSFNDKYSKHTSDKIGSIPFLYTGDKKMKELRKALSGVTPKLIACLCNHSQLSIINSLIHQQATNVAVIVDEIDSVNYVNEPLSKTGEELRELFENCGTKFGITATVFNVVCNEESLRSSNVFVMGEQSVYGTYKGVLNIMFKEIPSKNGKDVSGPSHTTDDQFSLDPNIIPFYSYLGGEGMFRQENYNLDEDHPVIVLHKTTNLVCQHMTLFREFMKNDQLKWNWTVIVYNGSGISLYSPVLFGPVLDHAPNEEGFYEFEDSSLQEVLQFLKENGGARRFSYICIVSGILAGRGINFVSKDKKWHLTHQYYIPSSSAKCADLLQGMRLCGVYKDPIPLTCHTPYKVKKDIIKSYYLQEDIVQRLSSTHQSEEDVRGVLQAEVFHKDKFPKGRSVAGERSRVKLKKTRKNDDGGLDLNLFDVKKSLEEDMKADPNSSILKVIPDHLSSTMYKLYEDVVRYLEEHKGWNRRATILDFFHSEGRVYSSIASSLTKMANKGVRYKLDNNSQGLFFEKRDEEWYVTWK